MKKTVLIIFVVAMVAVLGVGLTACNNATPQGQLANLLTDHNHETFVYDVVNTKDNSTGVYTVNLDAFNKDATVEFGNRTLENVQKGIRVQGELVFGNTKYVMGCYYNLVSGTSFMTPAYSFRTVTVDGTQTFSMQGRYVGGSFECERYIGEDTLLNSVKASGTVFDNNQFQQVLRSVTTFGSGLTLSFTTPIASATTVTTASLTANCSSTAKIKDTGYTDSVEDLKEEGIDCYVVYISRATEVKGMSQTLYYAVDNIKVQGWSMKNVLVRIVEPFTSDGKRYDMVYSLKTATLS